MVNKRNSARLEHAGEFLSIVGQHVGFGVNEGIKRKCEVNGRVVHHGEHKPIIDPKIKVRPSLKALPAKLDTGGC